MHLKHLAFGIIFTYEDIWKLKSITPTYPDLDSLTNIGDVY